MPPSWGTLYGSVVGLYQAWRIASVPCPEFVLGPVKKSPELVRVAACRGKGRCFWRGPPRNPHSHGLYGSVVGLYQECRIASDPPSAPLCKVPPTLCRVNKNIVSARSRTPFPSPLCLPRFGNALGVG